MTKTGRRVPVILLILGLALSLATHALAQEADGPTNSSDPRVPFWYAEYFDNNALGGEPLVTRSERRIDYSWLYSAPALGIPIDAFSVRWSNVVYGMPAGTYRFVMSVDDGGRLYVNDSLVLDEWRDQQLTTFSAVVTIPGGDTRVVMEYYDAELAATARLYWYKLTDAEATDAGEGQDTSSPPSGGLPGSGGILVDDDDDAFQWDGFETGWSVGSGGYAGGSHLWASNHLTAEGGKYKWARWLPELAPGEYEVYVFVPSADATTTNARYWVRHANGFTNVSVNQATNGGTWVSLGLYRFNGLPGEFVSLSSVTFEPGFTTQVGFDAVLFQPR